MICEFEEMWLQTNGIRLHVIQSGPVDGPLVVMLHGFPEFWYGWRHQIGPLAQAGFRVLVPDQRGYNLSDVPSPVSAYSLEQLARDVMGLVDGLGRKDCYLVGHDWGAAVAWYTALVFPDRIRKLAVLNVPHPRVMNDFLRKNPRQMLKSWYIGFFQIPGLADWLVSRDQFSAGARSLVGSSRPNTFSPAEIAEYRQAWQNSKGMTGMINWYRALVRFPARLPASPRLRMPVRILWGKQDAFLSVQMAEASAQWCDRVEVILFEEATHWVEHEEASAVANALTVFFTDSAHHSAAEINSENMVNDKMIAAK